ncbi:MAG: LysM peptidoglycan-binding domain-containing protein, partial [Pirellulales bacterium]|nr:LysM peptidoglycan-binding domain-containing protein [Pirellulales bacterium]
VEPRVEPDQVATVEKPRASEQVPPSQQQVVAKMTSTGDRLRSATGASGASSFDVANHPAFASQASPATAGPVPSCSTESGVRPAYPTAERSVEGQPQWPREVVHVVQDGDTLERLAQRYMGDEGRALEIFDMNRDILANPHQLPIDAELRIPVAPGRLLD